MGSIIYPGFKITSEWPTAVYMITKTGRNREKSYRKEKCLNISLSMYYHKGFHTNVFLLAERQWRRIGLSGWFTEFAPGIGISRTFLSGITYRVSEAGVVSQKPLAGFTYAVISIASGLGYDLTRSWNKPVRLYARISMLIFAPYNSYFYARPTLEIGLITKPSLFNKKHSVSNE